MLTLLTATGGRPLAWGICQQLMKRQTYDGPVHWIIVDDGPDAQHITFERPRWTLDVLRPQPYWSRGQNTQARNLLAGLDLVRDDAKLAVIEDDDYYAPRWLESVLCQLDRAVLVGESHARYYNVLSRRARQLMNDKHSSLCSTAMQGSALEAFRHACATQAKFIDLELWRTVPNSLLFGGGRNQVIGLKGLPGRVGIGMGHDRNMRGIPDPAGRMFAKWVGEDAARMYRDHGVMR